jgi:hypothetical protein
MRKLFLILIGLLLVMFLVVGVEARASSINYQAPPNFDAYSSKYSDSYFPQLKEGESCEGRNDIVLAIAPGGCQPSVVRSDLLAEQNVPVFCQIDAFEINPLIDVKQVKGIRFSGEYPSDVLDVGFHPARASLNTRDKLLGDPLTSNLGYAVVVLKKNEIEDDLPDKVEISLVGEIDYESGDAFGVGRSEFVLKPMTEEEWQSSGEKARNSFWNGKYSIRMGEANSEYAVVDIYDGDRVLRSVRVEKGSREEIYLPGMYCQAGLEIRYSGLVSGEDKAILEIGEGSGKDVIQVFENSRFLDGKCRVVDLDIESGNVGSIDIKCDRNEKKTLRISKENLEDKVYDDKVYENYGLAQESYEEVYENYGFAKTDIPGLGTYGEVALMNSIDLALKVSEEDASSLINLFLENYPDSESFEKYQRELEFLNEYDISESIDIVEINSEIKTLRVIGFEELKAGEESTATFSFGNAGSKEVKIQDGRSEDLNIEELKKLEVVEVLSEDSVRVIATCEEGDGDKEENEEIFRFGDSKRVCVGAVVNLKEVNYNKVGKIMLDSNAGRTSSEVALNFSVGIEKRAIELSDEKALIRLENLDESIKKWEDISNNLGNVVSGMKAACFATSAGLIAKNFLTGLDGTALARQRVMQGNGGWTQKCSEMVSKGEKGYETLNECFLGEADNINRDVEELAGLVGEVNDKIDAVERSAGAVTQEIFSESVNTAVARKAYCEDLKRRYFQDGGVGFLNCDNPPSYNDLRELDLNLRISESTLSEGLKSRAVGDLESIKTRNEELQATLNSLDNSDKIGRSDVYFVDDGEMDNFATRIFDIGDLANGYSGSGNKVALVKVGRKTVSGDVYEGGVYGIVLQESDAKFSKTGEVYKYDIQTESLDLTKDFKGGFLDAYRIGEISKAEPSSYVNRYKNPEVKYYETSPYRGLPALVPFDIEEGWYVATKPVLSGGLGSTLTGGSGRGTFDDSGRAVTYYIGNVGGNGLEEFSTIGDDKIQGINTFTGQDRNLFPGLSEEQASDLIRRAENALREATRQYGNDVVKIEGISLETGVSAVVSETQCQDFMSPEDCNLLFNVCDPVICPASRCNLGGKYQVTDVIQSGIIGSAVLCLPNIREGIVVPVCLSGLQAGVDGFVSILRGHRACLQESLDTGRTIGTCDAIHSVYMCDFFWNQVAPAAEVIIPRLVEVAYGQGARGGGEYLSVRESFENTESSIEFFTKSYAVNSLEAFKARNIQQAGTQVCKSFVGVASPTSFESLIEPDSPTQFHAWFDTYRYSSATIPATNQYKVFYHIFAGRDEGVNFQVFLRRTIDDGIVNVPNKVVVDSGFISRGEERTETKDFTAPEGYGELCVAIDNEEECGFSQVSTSFAINALRDEIVKDELERTGIRSERECISGGSNPLALLNPNLQSIAEEAIEPEIYNRGVVRVCGTANPGIGTDFSRWVDVGYCDDEKLRCWLDKDSVEKAITEANLGAKNEALEELGEIQRENLQEQGFILDGTSGKTTIKEIGEERESIESKLYSSDSGVDGLETEILEFERNVNIALSKMVLNSQKARVLLEKARFRDVITRFLISGEMVVSGEIGIEDGRDGGVVQGINSNRLDMGGEDADGSVESPGEEFVIKISVQNDLVLTGLDVGGNKRYLSISGEGNPRVSYSLGFYIQEDSPIIYKGYDGDGIKDGDRKTIARISEPIKYSEEREYEIEFVYEEFKDKNLGYFVGRTFKDSDGAEITFKSLEGKKIIVSGEEGVVIEGYFNFKDGKLEFYLGTMPLDFYIKRDGQIIYSKGHQLETIAEIDKPMRFEKPDDYKILEVSKKFEGYSLISARTSEDLIDSKGEKVTLKRLEGKTIVVTRYPSGVPKMELVL